MCGSVQGRVFRVMPPPQLVSLRLHGHGRRDLEETIPQHATPRLPWGVACAARRIWMLVGERLVDVFGD